MNFNHYRYYNESNLWRPTLRTSFVQVQFYFFIMHATYFLVHILLLHFLLRLLLLHHLLRNLLGSMNLFVLLEVVVELTKLQVVLKYLPLVEFNFSSFVSLVLPPLAYVIQHTYHKIYSLKLLVYGQIQIDRGLCDWPISCFDL